MPIGGAIATRVRAILPVTWNALEGDSRYGDALLQTAIDTAKDAVTGQVVASSAETTYPLIVRDFIAKVAALELINPGIDFWMNEPSSESAEGTNENHTFVDRAEKLKELRDALLAETRDKADEIAEILGFTRVSSKQVPRINTMDDPFLTPSHQEFPRPYIETART
jgi:hypothetical protein